MKSQTARHATLSLIAVSLLTAANASLSAHAVTASGSDGFLQHNFGAGKVAGWASISYLEEHPNAVPGFLIRSSSGDTRPRPTSADGCNLDVCIDVEGESLFVSRWSTQAFGNVGCTNAFFHSQAFTGRGQTICPDGSGPGVYYDNTGPVGYYQDTEELCNSWSRIAGYPCIEIQE